MSTTITRLNPEPLHETPGYHHVTLVEGRRWAFLAGQCPLDRSGKIVKSGPGALEAQVDQVVLNASAALTAAGARPHDVVRSVIYVVSENSGTLAQVWRRLRASSIAPAFTTASTLLGVAALGYADQLIELDLTAALPD